MSERGTARAKKSVDASVPSRTAKAATAELLALRAELSRARVQIAELERRHVEAVNRIDWLIDSLHNPGD